MKHLVLIPDGMGDRPLDSLGGKTPLEAARTPHMDHFASRGVTGLVRNIPDGYTPGTDIGCMSAFGYDPRKYFTGRGPLEAAELGVKLGADELAFRCNLVTTGDGRLEDFSADHVSTAEARELLSDLDAAVSRRRTGARFYPGKGTGYRNLAVFEDPGRVLGRVRCTPPHDIMGRPYADYLPQGPGAERLVRLMEESRELFADHPVNRRRRSEGRGAASMIWLWGQGFSPELPTYYRRYGFRGGVITAVDLLKGIAIHAGLDVIRVPGVTGFFDTNYVGKAQYAINALRSRDLVIVHVESTDEAGHMGDPALKIRAIEDVDRLVLGTLREGLEEFKEYKVMVLPDHFTCVETRTHASDPVPFLAFSTAHRRRGPAKFCERTAARAGLEIAHGHELMDAFVHEKIWEKPHGARKA